jgi:hypothetical protein
MGVDPATAEDARKGPKNQPFVDGSRIAFTGNEYGDDLAAATSGRPSPGRRRHQLQADNGPAAALRRRVHALVGQRCDPQEGGPQGAAEQFMDYVCDPPTGADRGSRVNYVAPVVGTKEAIVEIDPALAENPLIFPDEADL